ncbi:MAG TPA: alpha/beta fold hydrolase, partial [Patescibacteria group bacterium]|nr:alpha/beta fold hydrolase [Patescibacteria group bacterium]
FVMLPGGEPATMYLPGPGYPFFEQFPKPQAQRPPALVLIHGFSGDRVIMSGLARRLAQNGYAVLAIDVSGHGQNRNPFNGDEVSGGNLREDVRKAVEFLRNSNFVDGSRIVVMGHSMGSGAALDYATNDPNLKAAVMISGGWVLGPQRPKNALFIFAERDPDEPIQQTSIALAEHLAGVTKIELGKSYGDFAQGTAVEAIRMPGLNHVTIVNSPDAAATIVKWLDSSLGISRTAPLNLVDSRVRTQRLAVLAFVILLIPLGRLCGSIVATWPQDRPGPSGWVGELILVGVLFAAMPLTSADPASFVPVIVGSLQVSWFAVASLFILGVFLLIRRVEWQRVREGFGAALIVATVAFALVYACHVAFTIMLHNVALTPERLMVMVMAVVLTFPFWMGFELLVRRGGVAISTVWGLLGRILILVLMAIGATLNVLPFVLLLVLPILAIAFVMLEIFAASAYSTSRNLTLIAAFETLWFAWMLAATNPITFMF